MGTVLNAGAFTSSPGVSAAGLGFSNFTIETPTAAGGSLDVLGRTMQPALQKILGVPVVVRDEENGANGFVAGVYLAQNGANCSTVYAANLQQIQYNLVTKGVPFKANGMVVINNVLQDYVNFLVLNDSPYQTFKEFLDAAKASPGKLTVGVNDLQTANGAGMLALEKVAGVKFDMVPFGGSGQMARTALLGGHLDASATNIFNSQSIAAQTHNLAVQWPVNNWKSITDNAPTMTSVVGKTVPSASAAYIYVANASCVKNHPATMKTIANALNKVAKSKSFKTAYTKLGEGGAVDVVTGAKLKTLINASAKLTKTPSLVVYKG